MMEAQRTDTESSTQRPTFLLIGGMVVGILAAASGLLAGSGSNETLPPGVVARVNDQFILIDDYERLLQALASDRRGPIDDDQRKYVLDRLIEEDLLIQRGLELGLAHHDTRVRKDLTLSMIDSVVADYRDLEPSDEELQDFLAENADFFAQSGRFRVRQIWCRAPTLADADAAYRRAREAGEKLQAGEPFEKVLNRYGDIEVSPVPNALLPASKLADYLGPTALRAVMALEVGGITEPIRSSTGYHVLQLVERGENFAPEFSAIRDQVQNEFRRRAADEALRNYLDELRARADVRVVDELP